MTVKELKEKLENAWDENAEVVVNTEHGELPVVCTIGHYMHEPFVIECVEC